MTNVTQLLGTSAANRDLAVVEPTPDKAPTAVDALVELVREDLAQVNRLIVNRMESQVPLIPTLAGYLVQSGGKRLRPMLTLAAARLCGYGGSDHQKLAATVEFIHTATLLHDDVVDESTLRRGNLAANEVWGNQASILVGDFLFSQAFRLMVEVGDLRVLDVLSHASSVIAEGEVMQLANATNIEAGEDTYLQIVSSKTAALFAAAAEVGAIIAGSGVKLEAALRSFGNSLGIAFQLVDDALDFMGEQQALGKTIGDDFREGKCTLPVLLAFEKGDAAERAFWRRTMERGEQETGDLMQAIQLISRHNTINETLNRARDYAATARAALMQFPDGPYRQSLDDLIDFCVDRAY